MRQRKLTALMLSAAMSISAFAAFTVTASAADSVTIINGDYANLTATAYTADSTKKLNAESWGFNVEYNNGWDDGNGIKIELPDMSGKKGTFAVSVNVKSFYWGDNPTYNTAKVFIENAEGVASDTVLEAYGGNEEADEYNGRTATVSGDIEYDATADGTYYLCIKHPSGTQQYQSISVTYTAAEEETPAETEVEITGGYFWANDSYPAPEGYVVENGALKKEGTDEQVHVKQGYIENATFNKINVTVTWHPGEADEKSETKTLDAGGTITGPAVFYVLLGMDGYQSHTVTATAVAE